MVLTVVFVCLLVLVSSQDECERLVITDLGSTDSANTIGLISKILTPAGESPQDRQPTVTVLDMNIVCEAQAVAQDCYRYMSVVATFTCFSPDARIAECQDSSVNNTRQFDFGCIRRNWIAQFFNTPSTYRMLNPLATLTTEKESRCSYCIVPSHHLLESLGWNITADTHCRRCSNCTTGLQRCYIDGLSEVCCNYFYQNVCVMECPQPLIPVNFECQIPDCGILVHPANGTVLLSSGTSSYLSNARYECNSGFVLQGEDQRTCLITGQWSGNTPNCSSCNSLIPNCKECVALHNTFNCIMCSSGFNSDGMECRARVSTGCDTSCRIVVSLGVLLGIIGIISVSVYRYYKKTHISKHSPESVTVDSLQISTDNKLQRYKDVMYGNETSNTSQETTSPESEYEIVDEPFYDYPFKDERSTVTDQPQNDEELNTSANVAYAGINAIAS